MKKLRVLQVNKLYAPWIGGVEKVTQNIAEGLRDRTDMSVLVCSPKGPTVHESLNGVPVTRAGSLGIFFSMPVSFPFFRLFRRMSRGADIVQFHMPFPLADLAYLLSGCRAKTVVWWHSDVVRQKKLMFFYRPVRRAFLKRVDRIVVATQGHIDGSAELRRFRDKCVVIPFGIDIPAYVNHLDCGMRLTPSQPGAVKILFVGRLVYYKGVSVLLEAFAKVIGAELFLAGSGPLERELREQAEALGTEARVHFLGRLSDGCLKDCQKDCDFFVFPSVADTEAFGLVQLEAMVYGKPVVNTSLPTGVPFVSPDGVTGITVPPGDADRLAQALQKLTDDVPLRLRLGENARHRVRDEYGMDRMMDRLAELYASLVEKPD